MINVSNSTTISVLDIDGNEFILNYWGSDDDRRITLSFPTRPDIDDITYCLEGDDVHSLLKGFEAICKTIKRGT